MQASVCYHAIHMTALSKVMVRMGCKTTVREGNGWDCTNMLI